MNVTFTCENNSFSTALKNLPPDVKKGVLDCPEVDGQRTVDVLKTSEAVQKFANRFFKSEPFAAVHCNPEQMKPGASVGQMGAISIMAALDSGSNFFSMIRQIFNSVAQEGSISQVINWTGFGSGVLWAGLSISSIWKQAKHLRTIQQRNVEDSEGKRRTIIGICNNSFDLAGSSVYLGGKVAEVSVGMVSTAAVTCSLVSSVFFSVGAVIGIGVAAASIHRCRSFQQELRSHLLVQGTGVSEDQKYRAALQYLVDSITVPSEAKPEEGEAAKEARIKGEAEVKIDALKRRSSSRAVDELQKLIQAGNETSSNPAEVKRVVDLFLRDSGRKERLYWILICILLIALAAYIGSMILTSGIAPFVLWAIAAGISFGVGVYGFICERREARKAIKNPAQLSLTGGACA